MHTMILATIGPVALIAAFAVSIAPQATIVASEVSGEIDAIDIRVLTKNAKELPAEEWPAF